MASGLNDSRLAHDVDARLSLAALTIGSSTAPDIVRIAADVGFAGISLSASLSALARNKEISVVRNPEIRRQAHKALQDTGIRLDLMEGLSVEPEVNFTDVREAMLIMRDLGASMFNLTFWDPDPVSSESILLRYVELADELNFAMTAEFTPISQLRTLSDAAALVRRVNSPRFGILVDSLHLARCGASPTDMLALDPGMIAYSQICDGPLVSAGEDAYWHEALHDRLVPGEGELPLVDFIAALPVQTIISVEVPMTALEAQGLSASERAARALEGARRVFEAAQGNR